MRKKSLRLISLFLSLVLFCGSYMPTLTVMAQGDVDSQQASIGASNQETSRAPVPTATNRGATPGLQFHFDMETLADGKIINEADDTEFVVHGNSSLDVGAEGEKALRLDGTTYVELGTGFQPENEYTMMGWVKQDPNPTDGAAVFYRGNSGSPLDNLGFKTYRKSVYHVGAVASVSGAQNTVLWEDNLSVSHPNIIPTETWKHVAVTRSGSTVKIYVDGTEIYEKSDCPSGDFTPTTTPFYIGIDCNSSGEPKSHAFKGLLDDLRLYDTKLSAEEIADICGVNIAMDYELTTVKNGEVVLKLSKTPSTSPTITDVAFAFKKGDETLTPQNTQFSYDEASKMGTYTFTAFEDFEVIDVTVRYAEIEKTAKIAKENYGLKYRFDMESIDGEGKITNSVTGEKFAITGKQTLVKGKQGDKALELDGTISNYVKIGTGFQPVNAFTTMGWIKVPNPNSTQAIFARGNSGKPDDTFALKTHGGSVYSEFSNGSDNKNWVADNSGSQTPNNLSANKWQHMAVTRDGSNVRAYVNGVMVYENTNQSAGDFGTATMPMYIGIDSDSSGNVWSSHIFKGLMDDLRLYDFAVPSDEIMEIFQAESTDFTITDVSNGTIDVKLVKSPAIMPVKEDFILTLKDGDKTIQTTVNELGYNAFEQTIKLEFSPIENMTSIVKTIAVTLEYSDVTRNTEFTLEAGTNQAPQANNLTVINLSPKLGDEPAVKGMLEAKYTYADPENDVEGDTKFQWYMADEKEGTYTPILGIRTRTVILLDKYVGKYLKCEVKVADLHGNISGGIFTLPTNAPVKDTEGNPLTDWFYEAEYGVAHHFLSNYFNLSGTFADDTEKWDRQNMTWDDFVGQFDAEAYAKQIDNMGAKYVLLTLGQNSGSYCAPNPVYDKYMQEAGFIDEGEQNPKTVSMENDLPMKIADALEPYGIELMLYLPSNPPHSASWDESGTPNGYGYFGDYRVTKEVFNYTPGADGVPSQRSRKVLSEMVEWWSEHYSDKISGWWFDGCYYGGVFEGQTDMTQEYNLSTLANAAKAGNPYNIVTFNQGMSASHVLAKSNDYQDYTAGETQDFNHFPVDGRWSKGPSSVGQSDDCQNFLFGPLGNRQSWQNGWGCKGTSRTPEWVIDSAKKTIAKDYVAGFDIKVNVHGKIDPAQYAQMIGLKEALRGYDVTVTGGTGGGSYLADATVTITAEVPVGKIFDGWLSDDVVLADANAATTSFSMPAKNVTITAKFKADPGATVDKSALGSLLVIANGKVEASYTPASWSAFDDTKATAQIVYDDTTATQAEVNSAIAQLTTAIDGLVLVPGTTVDKSALVSLLAIANGKVEASYTPASWTAFVSVRTTSQGVCDSPSSTQQEVNNATAQLTTAIDGLVLVSGTTVDKSALGSLLAIANGKVEASYTPASWSAFDDTKATAQIVYDDTTATQQEVNSLIAQLTTAIDGLVLVPGTTVDKSALGSLLAIANGKVEASYTPASWTAFVSVRTTSQGVCDSPSSTQQEVNNATAQLTTAIDGLVLVSGTTVDKSALGSLLAIANGKVEASYTPASWSAFDDTKATAQIVYDDTTATQQEVNSATAQLTTAIDGLVLVSGTTVDKSALGSLLAIANEKVEASYTPESWTAFVSVRTTSQGVCDSPSSTQQEVNSATAQLTAQIQALVEKAAPPVTPPVTPPTGPSVVVVPPTGRGLTGRDPGRSIPDLSPNLAQSKSLEMPFSSADAKAAFDKTVAALPENPTKIVMKISGKPQISQTVVAELEKMALEKGLPLQINLDTVVNNKVVVRIALISPLTKPEISTTIKTSSAKLEANKEIAKKYGNGAIVADFKQQGNFGGMVKIFIKLPAELIGKPLEFHRYSPTTKAYTLEIIDYIVDANGYISFETNSAENLIICEKKI